MRMTEIDRTSTTPKIRKLTQQDISSLCRVTDAVGWSFSYDRMAGFLRAGHFWGHCADNRVISSAGIFPCGEDMAAIGIVIVSPEYQNQGLGKRLMEVCLENTESPAAMLVATEMGVPLYLKSGFRTINTVQRWVFTVQHCLPSVNIDGEGLVRSHRDTEVRSHRDTEVRSNQDTLVPGNRDDPAYANYVFEALSVHHIPSIVDLDYQFTGLRRRQIFNAMVYSRDKRSPAATPELMPGVSGVVAVSESTGLVEGFTLVTARDRQIQIGPVMAPSDSLAIQLLRRTLQLADCLSLQVDSQRAWRIDVLAHHTGFAQVLESDGWKLEKTSPLMLHGSWDTTRYNQHTYGLIDPAFG